MKTFDFRKVPVLTSFEGEPQEVDLSKQVGNLINNRTSDFAVSDFARYIYFKGEVEITPEFAKQCLAIINQSDLIVPVKRALIQAFTIEK